MPCCYVYVSVYSVYDQNEFVYIHTLVVYCIYDAHADFNSTMCSMIHIMRAERHVARRSNEASTRIRVCVAFMSANARLFVCDSATAYAQ